MSKNTPPVKSKSKSFIFRGILGATVSFVLCLMLMPLLLLRTDDPGAFAGAGSAVCISVASLCGSYFYSKGNPGSPWLSFIICAGSLCLLILALSLVFGGGKETNMAFSAVIYGCTVIFSAIGVYFASRSKQKKRKGSRHRRNI